MAKLPRVRGMTKSDRHILEFLWNSGDPIVANPSTIAANIDYQPNTVHKRVRALQDVGLLEYADETSGIYQLTQLGHRFFEGDLRDDELQRIENEF